MTKRSAEQALRGELAEAEKALERAGTVERAAKDAAVAAHGRHLDRQNETAVATVRVGRLKAALVELVDDEPG